MKPLKYRRQPRPVLRLQAWAQRLARQAAAGNEAGRPDRNKRIPPSLDLQLLVFAVLTFTSCLRRFSSSRSPATIDWSPAHVVEEVIGVESLTAIRLIILVTMADGLLLMV